MRPKSKILTGFSAKNEFYINKFDQSGELCLPLLTSQGPFHYVLRIRKSLEKGRNPVNTKTLSQRCHSVELLVLSTLSVSCKFLNATVVLNLAG